MKKTNLDELLERYIAGRVTSQEKKKIEAWLDVKKTEEGKDLVLDEGDEERLFRKITAKVDNVRHIQSFRPHAHAGRAFLRHPWFRAAAVILFLAACSYTLHVMTTQQKVPGVFVATNDMDREILSDGSIVWLHKNSKLTFTESADGKRRATLKGEGLFEIAKDPFRPFIITCGEALVTVVGTSFNLKSTEAGLELKVLTGKVRLTTSRDTIGLQVTPEEMAIYQKAIGMKKTRMESEEVQAVTASTGYNMAFKNASLKTVVARIESKFDIEVILENPAVNECHVTADFTDHSLENTMAIMRELLDIDYRIEKGTVTITGKGCH